VIDIEAMRKVLLEGKEVEYKAHCLKRMVERGISREDIKNCVLYGTVIEDYPLENTNSDNSFPSCLMLGWKKNEDTVIHVVVGFNGVKIIFISAYYPNPEKWESDFKTRRM